MDSISRTKADSQWRLERPQDINLDFIAWSRDLCSSGLILLTTMGCVNDGIPVTVLEARAASDGYLVARCKERLIR